MLATTSRGLTEALENQATSSSIENPTDLVGIIFPPPDVRQVIDKTAMFVAKNGLEFEQKIMKEQKDTKFNFLDVWFYKINL